MKKRKTGKGTGKSRNEVKEEEKRMINKRKVNRESFKRKGIKSVVTYT